MKRLFVASFLLAAVIPNCSGARLAYSTYLRYGFKPVAMTSDAQGNLYLAGSAVVDPLSRATSAVVVKLDPTATKYLYVEYLDSSASDTIGAITVDAAGNLYVTGTTSNPYFQVLGGSQLGAPPTGSSDTRTFVTKLNPAGVVLFSALVGGSAVSSGSGIAVTPQGQILASGISGSGFVATQGAFSVPATTNKWFLVELDAAASKLIFSATGIGGSSIALDAAGNIFVSGSSLDTNYPTTPGAYQTTLVHGSYCYGFCQSSFPGQVQHLTKVDPTGSKLIYSTGINDPNGGGGSTVNTGLAVDAAGNAYVTGTLFQGRYPLTTSDALGVGNAFLSKVDPTGSTLVFSVPVGGGGVARDSSGGLYTAGTVSTYNPVGFPGLTPYQPIVLKGALAWLPAACVPNNLTATESAYLLKLDSTTGSVLDAQWIDGTSATASSVALVGTKLWAAGVSIAGDVPFTPGALADTSLVPGSLPGTFLSAADFSLPPAPVANGAPVIGCVVDAGNFTHAGPVAAYQILSIFGANLGPATGVGAPDGTDPSIAGVTVTFDGNPAKMTYVSSSQINVMVPGPLFTGVNALPQSTVMQVSVNGTSIQRELAWTTYNLNLFASIDSGSTCLGSLSLLFDVLALNADGTRNSCANPAKLGSLVSFFVHGVGTNQLGLAMPDSVLGIEVEAGTCAANVENVARSGIVYKTDVRLPASFQACSQTSTSNAVNPFSMVFTYNGAPVGPLQINANPTPATPVRSQQALVWVTP